MSKNQVEKVVSAIFNNRKLIPFRRDYGSPNSLLSSLNWKTNAHFISGILTNTKSIWYPFRVERNVEVVDNNFHACTCSWMIIKPCDLFLLTPFRICSWIDHYSSSLLFQLLWIKYIVAIWESNEFVKRLIYSKI